MKLRQLTEEKNVHRFFEFALLVKAVHSVLEIVSGILLATVSTDAIVRLAKMLTQDELLEDPTDLIANYILRAAQNLSVSSKSVAAFYLLSHGMVKLVLVLAVMRGYRWAYPAFMIALCLLIAYQSYQLTLSFSAGLAALTLFDVLVLGLTWHEYRLVRLARRTA
jgi:uncharacterized membrane protein